MRKETWGWIIGGGIFSVIVGLWVWQLPSIVSRANSGRDDGLFAIMTSISGAKDEVGADLGQVQEKFESSMDDLRKTAAAHEAEAAAITELKQRLDLMNEAMRAVAADKESSAPAGLPPNPDKPEDKK